MSIIHLWITSVLILFRSNDHSSGGNASGVSTPFNKSGGQTSPVDDESTIAPSSQSSSLLAENVEKLTEKLHRRRSIGRATMAVLPNTRASSDGPSQEHSEQGKVKWDVYMRYLEAASKVGFSAFIAATILQQVFAVLGNIVLRNWGDHNQDMGETSEKFDYLLRYGLFALSSVIFSATASILIWVLCCVRSARHLHDSVRTSSK